MNASRSKTQAQFKANRLDAYNLVHEGIQALGRASKNGIAVDLEYCKQMHDTLEDRMNHLTGKFFDSKMGRHWKSKYRTPNYNADGQVADILFNEYKLPPLKLTPAGGYSVDNETLNFLSEDVPELNLLNKLRKYKKVKDTYLKGFIKETVDGFIHATPNLHTVTTYRSSYSDPNFQNVPKRDPVQKRMCRRAIKPRKGHQIVAADYGGIEVKIANCYHLDPVMTEYNSSDEADMHGDMAGALFCMNKTLSKSDGPGEKTLRNGAKNGFVFPQFYGDYYKNNANALTKWAGLPTGGKFDKNAGILLNSGQTIGEHLVKSGIKTFDDFVQHVKQEEDDFWNRRFKVYQEWKKAWLRKYQRQGYIDMLTGFRCSGIIEDNSVINYPIQGTAFHCLLKSFIEIDKWLVENNFNSLLIGQIHDEMVFDMDPAERDDVLGMVQYITCEWLPREWPWIIVPMEIEASIHPVDGSWADEAEEIKLAA